MLHNLVSLSRPHKYTSINKRVYKVISWFRNNHTIYSHHSMKIVWLSVWFLFDLFYYLYYFGCFVHDWYSKINGCCEAILIYSIGIFEYVVLFILVVFILWLISAMRLSIIPKTYNIRDISKIIKSLDNIDKQ